MTKIFAVIISIFSLATLASAAPTHAAQIDPKARQLLMQMDAAYKALISYSDTGETKVIDGGKTTDILAQVMLKKPNLANITVTQQAQVTQAVSDGTSVYATVPSDKMQYTKQDAATGTRALGQAFQKAGGDFLGYAFLQQSVIPQFLNNPTTKSVVVGPAGVVAGVPTDTVIASRDKLAFTFFIDRNDHLLRQLTLKRSGESAPFLIETHTNARVNPDLHDAAFAFTPPAGAKEVTPPTEAQAAPYDPRLTVGAAPFAFQAADLAGKPVTLDQYKGKVVLLDFWATWCPPCREEVPNVVAAYQKYHAQGFDVLGISLDHSGDRAKLISFLTQNHMPWRQVYGGGYWESKIPQQYGIQSIPFALLLGRDGKIAAVDVRGDALQPAIEAALAR